MQFVALLMLLAIAIIGLLSGFKVRRTSFMAGTYLTRLKSDKRTGGWIESYLMTRPSLCNLLDAVSDVLPGPPSDISETVETTTTFTRLQSRALLHRYYRWQIHSLLRLVLVLVFCGVLISLLPIGLTQGAHRIVAGGSTILFIYAVSSWWRISNEDKANRRICSNGEGDSMLDAFAELSQSAFRQAMAFALIFGANIGLQVVEFIDVENRFALNGEVEGQNPLDAPWLTDLTKPLV